MPRQLCEMPADLPNDHGDRPWLSAIVPSHNGDRWLAETLQSVVDQHDDGIEVVVVDSSDVGNSLEIVARFADRLAVRAYRRTDLLPWPEKTNFAVAVSRADWICMLHQDDLWLPGRCAAVRRWLAAAPGGVMHLHPSYIIDTAGRRRGTWRCPLPADGTAAPPQLLLERLLVQNFVAIPAPTIRRETYLAVGGLDERLWYTADWDLYLKLATAGEVHYHDQPLASYRIHGTSLTSSGSRDLDDFRAQMQTVVERHIDRLGAAGRHIRPTAMASIDVNVALAAASQGKFAALPAAIARLLTLGPGGLRSYLHASRIVERLYPRLRARLAGAL
jgi:hypothetical protein